MSGDSPSRDVRVSRARELIERCGIREELGDEDGENRVVDEVIVSFTHDTEMPFMLPGVEPTGRSVDLPHTVVVGFRDGKVEHEHIYWDQACVLAQIGLLDPKELPITGAEQARALRKVAES